MRDPGQVGVTFHSDGYRLLGTLFLAHGREAKPTAILLHGIPGIEKNYDLAHSLREGGWNSLIFHYRGCWGSQGPYQLETIPRDVKAAIDLIECGRYPEIDRSLLFLIGHSLGGWAAILAASEDPRIRAVAVVAPITDPRTLQFSRSYVADEIIPWVHGTNTYAFLREWASLSDQLNPIEQVSRISPRPILIIHSQQDELVPYAQSVALFARSNEPKTFLTSTDANHAFTWHRKWLREVIYEWVNQQV